MSKQIIAVDIDEVLFPFVREFAQHHNEKYATKLLPDHFTSYQFEEIIGIDRAEAIKRVYEFTGFVHETVEPIDDAEEGINRLTSRFDLALLTARHPQFQKNTNIWLQKHFPGAFHSLTMIGYEHDTSLPHRTKAEVCKEINAIALVDDSPKYITQAVQSGVKGVLFGDYPWNQVDMPSEGVVRVNGWIELAEHFGV